MLYGVHSNSLWKTVSFFALFLILDSMTIDLAFGFGSTPLIDVHEDFFATSCQYFLLNCLAEEKIWKMLGMSCATQSCIVMSVGIGHPFSQAK